MGSEGIISSAEPCEAALRIQKEEKLHEKSMEKRYNFQNTID